MHPKGANKNKDDHAIFSKDGPNLMSPALTNKPRVIPKIYKLKNNNSKEDLISKLKLQIVEMLKELQGPIQLKF